MRNAAVRAADVLLRVNGGSEVVLRVPTPAVAGDVAEELGLVSPEFQDVRLGPAVPRDAGTAREVLVSASAVKKVVGSLAFESAEVLFMTAAALVVEGVAFGVGDVVAMSSGDEVYCYRVGLRVLG